MKKQISPAAAGALIALVVIVAAAIMYKGMNQQVKLPDKPPSGPITLPPSQMGRKMPAGNFSGGAKPGQ